MRLQPKTIMLGDASWSIRPLTLAQVQAIEPLLDACLARKAGSVETGIAVFRIALARDHAAEAATLDVLEASALEVAVAMREVLQLGGFLETPLPGEAGAGPVLATDRPAATGGASTPA